MGGRGTTLKPPPISMNTTVLSRLRYDPELPRLAVAVAIILLAQALVTPQTHTYVEKTLDGFALVLCTWDTNTDSVDDAATSHSPALIFSSLTAELIGNVQPSLIELSAPRIALHHPTPTTRTDQPTQIHAFIRAPPYS